MQSFTNGLILDGDEMRNCLHKELGFSEKDRYENCKKIALLAKELDKQTDIIVAVIAPTKKIRDMIDVICSPFWIYIERTLPERKGHFYEVPEKYDMKINMDIN